MLNKRCKVYSFQDFFNREEMSNLDKAIYHLKRNKKKYIQVIIILAYIMITIPELAFADDKVVSLGNNLISKVQLYAGVVAAVMAVIEVAGELVKGGRNHFQIIFKYGVGYGALMLVPYIFEIIRNLF